LSNAPQDFITAFEPFDRWTAAAVVARNQTALAALYATTPAAQAQTPQAKTFMTCARAT
jgi:hypothetical protein